jgi:hypothetical protein
MQGLIVRFCRPWFNHMTGLCQSGRRNDHLLCSSSLDLDEEALAVGVGVFKQVLWDYLKYCVLAFPAHRSVGVWFDRQVHFHLPLFPAATR